MVLVRSRYELSYNKERRGWLSRYLQLTYRDGTRLDNDIRLISDNYEPAPDHAVKYAYLGPGNRIYPLRMGPDTTPRLWAAKHGIALAAMRRSNEQFEEFPRDRDHGCDEHIAARPDGAGLSDPAAAAGRSGRVKGSFTRWVKIVDPSGKTVRLFHDTFDRTGKFIHRGVKIPGPERHAP